MGAVEKTQYISRPDGMPKAGCGFISIILFAMSISQRRHGQDKTVLSFPCQRCERNWRQDTVLSCLDPVLNLQLFRVKYIE